MGDLGLFWGLSRGTTWSRGKERFSVNAPDTCRQLAVLSRDLDLHSDNSLVGINGAITTSTDVLSNLRIARRRSIMRCRLLLCARDQIHFEVSADEELMIST